MSRKNFYICTDQDGNMPVLSNKPLKKAWVKYVNDTPVLINPYPNQDRVWDYGKSTMLSLVDGLTTYAGKPMAKYTGAYH